MAATPWARTATIAGGELRIWDGERRVLVWRVRQPWPRPEFYPAALDRVGVKHGGGLEERRMAGPQDYHRAYFPPVELFVSAGGDLAGVLIPGMRANQCPKLLEPLRVLPRPAVDRPAWRGPLRAADRTCRRPPARGPSSTPFAAPRPPIAVRNRPRSRGITRREQPGQGISSPVAP